ncbi:MAG: GIY-YIG nuclease family protein [Dehalococcoidia bacterium]
MMRAVRKLFRYLQGMRLAMVLTFLFLLSLNLITTNMVVAANPCLNSWNVTVQGINSSYKPGETISGTATYSIRNDVNCPACVQQILVGIIDENRQAYDVTCIYDSTPNSCPSETTGSAILSLKSPPNPGTYQILASNYLQNSGAVAKALFPRNPSSDRVIATIQVSGSTVASSPNNTVTTPSVTPPVTPPTNWNNPITAITSWWQQNQKTIFSVIALILLVYVGLKYLINKKLNGLDILLLSVAVLAIVVIYVIPWILIYWTAILISLAILIVVAVIAWQKGWINLGLSNKGDIWKEYPITQVPPNEDKAGYIYVMHSPAHPKDWFKIGKTRREPDHRSNELSGETGSPVPLLLVNDWKVSDRHKAESMIHHALEKYRVNPKR